MDDFAFKESAAPDQDTPFIPTIGIRQSRNWKGPAECYDSWSLKQTPCLNL